jgi:hypothetical protein
MHKEVLKIMLVRGAEPLVPKHEMNGLVTMLYKEVSDVAYGGKFYMTERDARDLFDDLKKYFGEG